MPPHGCKSRISSPPHDSVHHVRIQWNGNPLLLFSDPIMVEALPVEHFPQQASHMTHQQHLQMGLRKGIAILIYYVVENTHYQAVLIAEESVMNRGRRGENRLWKRVTPSVTEFACLPTLLSPFARMHSIEPLIVPIVHLTLLTWDWTRRILWLMSLWKTFCI